ncbi:MAG: prepilin-type N-terminal cleavage/methylation domain-containing protein [Planctomycetota bacterium]
MSDNCELRVSNCELGETSIRNSQFRIRSSRSGFTLIEMMVSVGILLVLGVMLIGFLRGALNMTRSGTARGQQFETAQTVLRVAEEDFSQVLGLPAHPDGPADDPAFVVMEDPYGRQMVAFTRAWGEEQSTLAGYDSGRGGTEQGYSDDFTGRNVRTAMRASHGAIEVVYLLEPTRAGTNLYRAERSPPDPANGLITKVASWCAQYQGSDGDDLTPMADLQNPDGPFAMNGEALWTQFELVAENVLCFAVECWDDWQGRTSTWNAGSNGPVASWSISQRSAPGQYPLPRAIRLTLVVAAEGTLRNETQLTGALSDADNSVYVDNADGFPDVRSPSAYLRVNGEMIAYASRSGRTFGSCVRGTLGSRRQQHNAGSVVQAGELFQRVIQLPVTR